MRFFFLFSCVCLLQACSFKRVTKNRDIVYDPQHQLQLDVYGPRKSQQLNPVMVFVHGGNWRAGDKSIYKFFGKGMARKGFTTVVINYRHSDKTTYAGMGFDVATAIKWAKENIYTYHGDPRQIYISGHSAGGHLAALVCTDVHYFDTLKMENPIKAAVLIDAFGLDMHKYLVNSSSKKWDSIYRPAFTGDTLAWKRGSPINYLHEGMPRFLLMLGGKTYPAITEGNLEFYYALKEYPFGNKLVTFKKKKHVGMMSQFYNSRCRGYREILGFISEE